MTLGQLLLDLARRFESAGVPSPRVDAEMLAGHVLKLSRLDLMLRRETELAPGEIEKVEVLARRREAREPLQHLLGEVEWGGLLLKVTPAALIPRPETEVLLDLALDAIAAVRAPRVLDVGTGTGALALGIKLARPDARVMGTDLSAQALDLARENADRLSLNVSFALGDLHANLSGPFDLIVSNPPYLPQDDAASAQPEVRHDPACALYAGQDGLEVARRLAEVASELLTPAGTLALELDPRNVGVLAAGMTDWRVEVKPDLAGLARFLLARRAT